MVCFLISLMLMIVSTRFHGNTIFLRVRGRKRAGGGVLPPPGLRSYKILGPFEVKSLFNCDFDR